MKAKKEVYAAKVLLVAKNVIKNVGKISFFLLL